MRCIQWIVISCIIIFVSGCSEQRKSFLHPNPYIGGKSDNFKISDPENTVVLIYNKGTRNSHQNDYCSKAHTPQIWKDLAGKPINGKNLYIYYLCPVAEGYKYIDDRALEIEQTLDDLISLGVPPNQLFLGGQSAGAWSSLVVSRNAPDKFNAVIAFAPAFASEWKDRHPIWWQKHHQEVAKLKKSQSMNALIYAFEDDPFNRISDIDFFRSIPGIEFSPLSWQKINGVNCKSEQSEAHFTAFKGCFTNTQKQAIKNFLEKRLPPDNSVTS